MARHTLWLRRKFPRFRPNSKFSFPLVRLHNSEHKTDESFSDCSKTQSSRPSVTKSYHGPNLHANISEPLAAKNGAPKIENPTPQIDESLDPRIYPITLCTFFMGTSISCIVPILPLFATSIGLSAAQYGSVISVIGLSRIVANIPLTCLVDSKGRRPGLVLGPGLSALCISGLGISTCYHQLLFFRMMSGIVSSAQMISSQLYLSDISKPSNRARTMAPNFIAWHTGFMLGPCLGGILADSYGLRTPFLVVGGLLGCVSVLNYFTLPETHANLTNTESIGSQVSKALQTWKSLIQNEDAFSVVLLAASFWLCMAGVQFCLFPLIATQNLGFTASELGSCYTLSALLNITLSKPSAYLSDTFGRKKIMIPACIMSVCGFALIPFATTYFGMLGAITVLSVGNAVLSTNPRAYLIDVVPEKERSQALAFMLTGGDIGLLLGGAFAGLIADLVSTDAAIGICCALFSVSIARFAIKAKNI